MSTKVYHNTSENDLNVIGVGVIPAGEKVSVTSDYQPHVVLENYPGLVDVTDFPGEQPNDGEASDGKEG